MSGKFVPNPAWPTIVELATERWGAPNEWLSKPDDIRFGTNGSKSVRPSDNTFHDHEAGTGGGYVDMHRATRGELPKRNGADGEIIAAYDYCDESGALLFQVVRRPRHRFTQRRPDGNGGWHWNIKGVRRVLYRLPQLLAAPSADPVFIAEGEKDVDRLRGLGLIATCNPGGAGKWRDEFGAPLRGRLVVILPDNDEAGDRHAGDVARWLHGIASSLRFLRLPDLPPKGDVSDWIDAGGTKDKLLRLVDTIGEDEAAFQRPREKPGQADAQPVILVLGGKRHEAADAGLAALMQAGIAFYQRDKALVRIASIRMKSSMGGTVIAPSIMPVGNVMLGRVLGQSARWEKIKASGETNRIDPPDEVVAQIAAMTDQWPFPPLRGLIDTPTLRPDGSLLDKPGYDPATGYVLANPPPMASIPDRPTWRDAEQALSLLNDDLLANFPFVDDASRSVAVSMLMTPVLRAAMTVVPMHVITAPEAGTGKSYLQDIAAAIAIGDRCPVMSISDNAEETEKRLIGAALAQVPIIALDNVNGMLMGDFLCQATERPLLQLRPLGTSNLVRIHNTFTTFCNGNNLVIAADQVRRCVQCALDANMETPEERSFASDPLGLVLADRGKYIRAILTIARAYIAAGLPDKLPARASYEDWSDRVRSALAWLSWPDPVATVATIRTDDPIRQQRAAVFTAWAAELEVEVGYHTSELIREAEAWAEDRPVRPALLDALRAVAVARGSVQQIDPSRLGQWLRRNLGTVMTGWKLTVDRGDQSRPRWRLIAAA